jgi:GT2 family glycosyltransferase
VEPESLDAAARRLAEERRRLESLRSDYSHLTKSRFHALRMLWISLKAFFGFSGAGDRYAVWSPGMAVSIGSPGAAGRELSAEAQRLAASWTHRIDAQPLNAIEPIVTVIIPVYNEADVTIRCLQSIADTWFDTMQVQIVVVDDGSTDETPDVLTTLPGLDYIRNGSNQGFVRACNRGAALARGAYVCFLNNDTVVKGAWLDHLVSTAEADSSIGAVGSKLVYPDGKLQDAGSIIWRDGTGWNYGRGENPADPHYNYVRDTDYVSGAALLIRRSIFNDLGGFSEEFVPAYYEDADLCFGVHSLGFRVVYQPRSEVIHYEGATSGRDLNKGAKRFQNVNLPKFRKKWAAALEKHFEPNPALVARAARRWRHGPIMLVVDSYVPLYDKDAGSSRLMQIVRILVDAGFNIIFLPHNFAPLQPYTQELQEMGVEVLHHVKGGKPMQAALDSVLPILDFAWICRPELFSKYEPLIRRNGSTKVIYDTIDLHFVRKRRETELLGGDESDWQRYERIELDAAGSADATVVVTESEKRVLQERGIENVFVVPTLHEMETQEERTFENTAGIVFIGGYNHPPNEDAARWLQREIMPEVWKKDPSITLTLLGSNPPDSVLAMESERIRVPGYVRDVTPYFMGARLFVAPLRYGAGMNGKVGHALSYKLPCVLTGLAADGFGLTNGKNCLIAEDAAGFADAILRLYNDRQLWTKFSESAAHVLAPFQPRAIKPGLIRSLDVIRHTERGQPKRVAAPL